MSRGFDEHPFSVDETNFSVEQKTILFSWRNNDIPIFYRSVITL